MSLLQHAQHELELAGLLSEEGDFYGGMTGKAVLELIEVFSKQGHSGMSAGIVVELFSKLAKYQQIGALTGKDEEWGKGTILDDILQNKRNSAVFKHADGRCTYNNAVIKRCPNGSTWTGPLYMTRQDAIDQKNIIRVEIKEFPFVPKTFYVDVLEEEVAKGDWVMWVKDPSQLEEILQYYKRSEDTNV